MTEAELKKLGYLEYKGYIEGGYPLTVYGHPGTGGVYVREDLGDPRRPDDLYLLYDCLTAQDPLVQWLLTQCHFSAKLAPTPPVKQPMGTPPSPGPFDYRAAAAKEIALMPSSRKPKPRNNDGLSACCQCGAPTKAITLFMSVGHICTKCGY